MLKQIFICCTILLLAACAGTGSSTGKASKSNKYQCGEYVVLMTPDYASVQTPKGGNITLSPSGIIYNGNQVRRPYLSFNATFVYVEEDGRVEPILRVDEDYNTCTVL